MKLKDIPFPKEYGSWGILITSCIIGVSLQQQQTTWVTFSSLAGIAALFMTKASIAAFIKRRHNPAFLFTFIYATAGLLFLAPSLWSISVANILQLSVIPLITVIVYAVSAYLRKERSSVVEFFAMAALTLPVLFFYTSDSNSINLEIVSVWLLSFLYFSASIFKVKMLIFRKRFFRIANLTYLFIVSACLSMLIYIHTVPWFIGAALLPLLDNLFSTFSLYDGKRNLKLIGILELIKGTVFAVILIIVTRSTFNI